MKQKKRQKRIPWEVWYLDAKEYRREHGNLLVPRCYVTANGRRLGRWIERQRAAYQGKGCYQICSDQIVLLEQLGMEWKRGERNDWMFWYEKAERYQAQHGNLKIPRRTSDGGYALGSWLSEQRKAYRGGKLSPQRREALEAIGVQWVINKRRPWEDWYADARSYYQQHGNLQVPYGYCADNGYALGEWIERQRERYWSSSEGYRQRKSRNPLPPDKAQQLEAIGMQWYTRKWRCPQPQAQERV